MRPVSRSKSLRRLTPSRCLLGLVAGDWPWCCGGYEVEGASPGVAVHGHELLHRCCNCICIAIAIAADTGMSRNPHKTLNLISHHPWRLFGSNAISNCPGWKRKSLIKKWALPKNISYISVFLKYFIYLFIEKYFYSFSSFCSFASCNIVFSIDRINIHFTRQLNDPSQAWET